MSNQLQLVLLGDGGTSSYAFHDLGLFTTQADRVKAALLAVEPFKSRAHQFDIVSFISPESLNVQRASTTSRLLVGSSSIAMKVCAQLGIPVEKGIILANTNTYGGAGGSTFATTYCGKDGPAVAVHEFAHSLASLLDEYLLYTTPGTVDNKSAWNIFRGPPTGEFQHLSAYRPNYSCASATCGMRTLYKPFCVVCTRLLNAALDRLAEPCILPDPEPTPTPVPVPTPVPAPGDPSIKFSTPLVDVTTATRFQVKAQAFPGSNPNLSLELFIGDDRKAGPITTKNVQGKWIISWWWSIDLYAAGEYALTATVTDGNGRVASQTVTVTRP